MTNLIELTGRWASTLRFILVFMLVIVGSGLPVSVVAADPLTPSAVQAMVKDVSREMIGRGMIPRGWKTDLPDLKVRLLTKRAFGRETSQAYRNPLQRFWMGRINTLMAERGYACYDEKTRAIYFIEQNLKGQPGDALRGVVAHELTHAFQDRNKKLIGDKLNRNLWTWKRKKRQNARRQFVISKIMEEGHALWVEQRISNDKELLVPQRGFGDKLRSAVVQAVVTRLPVRKTGLGWYVVGMHIHPRRMNELWSSGKLRNELLGPAADRLLTMSSRDIRRASKNPVGSELMTIGRRVMKSTSLGRSTYRPPARRD